LNVILRFKHKTFQLAFTQSKKEVQASKNHFLKKKDGCQICVNKPFFLSQWEAFLPWGLFDETNFTSSYL